MLPDPEVFVRVMLPAVRQAASIARALEGRVQNRPKRGEASEVKAALTVADSAAQEAVLVPLLEHFPGVRLAAEEDTPSVRRFSQQGPVLVVIDPIDGTLRFYLDGLGPYAVMVGLAVGGRYQAALVALPREGLCFTALRGRGARIDRDGAGLEPVRAGDGARAVMLSHDAPPEVGKALRDHGYDVVHGCGGALAVAPLIPGVCAGLRLARGHGGISIRGRIGALVAREAGALVTTGAGAPFPEAIDAPAPALLVAGDAAVLQDLRSALAAGAR